MEGGLTSTDDTETKAPDLTRVKRMFDDARNLTQEARNAALVDIDYYDGKQWTPDEAAALKKRGQPDIVINRTRAAVNGVLGVTERGRSEPRAYPRTPDDEESADAATDALRYVCEFNRFDRLRINVFKDILVPGSGAAIVTVDSDRQVIVEQVRWEEFFYDPRSRRQDFSDARYMGIAKWMYADDVKALYPGKDEDIEGSMIEGVGLLDESFQDRPQAQPWIDRKQRRVMVVELYHKEKGWQRCVFFAGGLLDYGPSPYLDEKRRPHCPIEGQSAYVDRENNRYGAVRDMRGPQDEINKRRSKLLHHLSVSQIQAVDPQAIGVNADEARAEAARPDGVIPFGWQKVPTNDKAQGQLELLQESKAEMERLGPNPAILGREGTDASGRALLARQQSGLIELAILFGAIEDWELRICRQIWARIKQYWTGPQWVRVTDDEGAPQFVGLNQPRGAPAMDPQTNQPKTDESGQPVEGKPVHYPATGMDGAPHPYAGRSVFGYKNTVAEMDVDIILNTQPESATIQQEMFQDLMQIAGSNPIYAQQVPFELLLKMSPMPHKREVLDQLRQYRQQQAQAQAQQAQEQQQVGMATAAANIEKMRSEATLNEAKASAEHAHVVIGGLSAAADAMQPAAGASGVSGQG